MTLSERLTSLFSRQSSQAQASVPERLLFLHIPKTAGTSLRLGLERSLGARSCHFDYGPKQRKTSRLVVQHVYEQPDLFRLGRELEHAGCRLLGGHVRYRKLAALSSANRVVAFLRHPRDQLLSHFAHLRHVGGFRGDFQAFLQTNHGAGCQTRTFSGFPLAGLGFIGVTERFADSVKVLQAVYGHRIEVLTRNVTPESEKITVDAVPDDCRQQFDDAVAVDLPAWQLANELLDARLASLAAGQVWVHGEVTAASPKGISGFAWHASGDSPVRVELRVNSVVRESASATSERPHLRSWNVPRNSFVGFDFRDAGTLNIGDEVEVCVAGSEQVLGRAIIQDLAG